MKRQKLEIPRVLHTEDIRIIVDSREQCPWDLSPFVVETGTLQSGDYSIAGLTHHVAIERKSLPDLIACVGRERARFKRELERLRAYPCRCVICECSWADLRFGSWRGKVTNKTAYSSVLSWMAKGIPFMFACDRDGAQTAAKGFLWHAARHCLAELQGFAGALAKAKSIVLYRGQTALTSSGANL